MSDHLNPPVLGTSLIATPEGRRLLSEASPTFFDTYYCGMIACRHRTAWLDRIEAARNEAKETGHTKALLFLAPRDHGKTEAGISVVTRAICTNRNVRVLWVAVSGDPARKRVRRIKQLLTSEKVENDWLQGRPWRRNKMLDEWDKSKIYIDRDIQSVDPTLEAVGAGGSVTGGHFDLIVLDDAEDDRTVYSATERRKTREWFRGTLMPMLANGGTIVVIGTRKHNDDLYYHLLEDPTFEIIRDPACFTIDEDGNKQPYIPPHTPVYENREGKDILVSCDVSEEAEEFHTLWPEYKGIQYLLKTLHSAERRMFQREYQHVVVDDQTAVFKWDEHLIPALDRGNLMSLYECPQGVQPFDLRVVQGWDLSLVTSAETAQAKDRDYTVGITWAEGPGGMRYLLGLTRERGVSMGRVQELIQGEYDKFDEMGLTPKMVLIEKNSFGELHLANLLENTTLPVQGHFTSAAKKSDPWEGVPSLVTLFEKHRVVLPSRGKYTKDRVGVLCDELVNLEASRHDDTVMALWIAETAHRPKYRGGDPVKPKRSVVRKVAKEEELDMSRYVLTNTGWKDGKAPPGLRRRKRRFG